MSQSLQLAPFDADYELFNSSSDITVHDPTLVRRNSYLGGTYQQAASYIATTPDAAYELSSGQFASYGESDSYVWTKARIGGEGLEACDEPG